MKPKRCLVLAITWIALSGCGSEPAVPEAGESLRTVDDVDSVTGTWVGDWGPSAADRNAVTLELHWDGVTLTGTVNPGRDGIELSAGSFDPGTGLVTMEANAESFRGPVHYMIEGRIEGAAITGSWTHDNNRGDFRITKQ